MNANSGIFNIIFAAFLVILTATNAGVGAPKTAPPGSSIQYAMIIEMWHGKQPLEPQYPVGWLPLKVTFANNDNRRIAFNDPALRFQYEIRYSPVNSPDAGAWKLIKPTNGPQGADIGGPSKDILAPGDTFSVNIAPVNYTLDKIGFYRITVIMDSIDTECVAATGVADMSSRFELVARSNTIIVQRTNAAFVDVTPKLVPTGKDVVKSK